MDISAQGEFLAAASFCTDHECQTCRCRSTTFKPSGGRAGVARAVGLPRHRALRPRDDGNNDASTIRPFHGVPGWHTTIKPVPKFGLLVGGTTSGQESTRVPLISLLPSQLVEPVGVKVC